MARQLTRGTVVLPDGSTIPESLASFHLRQVEARQDAANRMRESRANKLANIGDDISQIYRLIGQIWDDALRADIAPKAVKFGDCRINPEQIMLIPRYEDRLAEIARIIRTPRQSQVVADLLSVQLLGFRPVSSRVPDLIDRDVERVRQHFINPKRYHSPVKAGLTGRLAWDIIGATIAPQHGAVIDTPRYWYSTDPYQARVIYAPYTYDYPTVARYSTQVMSLGVLEESADGSYFAPVAIVTLDHSAQLSPKGATRELTGIERYRLTGSAMKRRDCTDHRSTPAGGFTQSAEIISAERYTIAHEAADRRKAYCMSDIQSSVPQGTLRRSIAEQAGLLLASSATPAKRTPRAGVPTGARRYRGLTAYAQERGGLHVRAMIA